MTLTLGCFILVTIISTSTASIAIIPDNNPLWIIYSEQLQLTCSGDRNITWYKDGKPVTGDGDVIVSKSISIIDGNEHHENKLSIHKALFFHYGKYNCSDGTNFQTRKVKVVRGKLTSSLSDKVTIFEGDSILMFCKYDGNIKLRVSWFKDNDRKLSQFGFTTRKQTFENKTVTTLLKTSKDGLAMSDRGTYYCKAGPLIESFTLDVLNDSCNGKLISGPEGIPNDFISASSYYKDILHDDSPVCVKWNQSICGGWSPVVSDNKQWLQISFPILKIVREIMSGRRMSEARAEWVTSYTVSYSQDGEQWKPYSSYDTNATIFEGNFDRRSYVITKLPVPIVAKHVRIHPLTWHRKIALRLEFQGCTLPTTMSTRGEYQGINVPDPLVLTCNVSGPKLPNIVWYKDGTRLLGNSEHIQTSHWTWFGNRIESTAVLKKMSTVYRDSGKYLCVDTTTRMNKTIEVTAAQLDMVPIFSHLWILKGHQLDITCQYRGTDHKEIAWANIGNLQKSGFYFSMNKKVERTVSITTSTVSKDEASLTDGMNITCSVGSLSRQIEIKVVDGKKVVDNLQKGSKELSLHCDFDKVFEAEKSFEIYWTKNQQPLSVIESMKGKFQYSFNSRTVTIHNPDITMAGHYECNILIDAGSNQQQHLPFPVELHAPPEVNLEGPEKVSEGETLDLYCKVEGYPLPKIAWLKDGVEISKTDARHNFMTYDNVENGHFVLFDVTAKDSGKYECKDGAGTTASSQSLLLVTVKAITLIDNMLMVCIVVSSAVVVLTVVCCVACLKCRQKPKRRSESAPPLTPQYSRPLLVKRYVDMEVVTKSKSLTSLEEIDQLPLPPPPVDPWEDTSTVDGGSTTYERIPKFRDRRALTDTKCA